jgi:predicted nucleic acid-binding protein
VTSRQPPGSLLVVDACCWIDLFATGRINEIVAALPYRLAVPRYVVEEEVLTTISVTGVQERCDFAKLQAGALVSVWDVETGAEKQELVRFAAHLDDGEASVCALAVVRGGAVATDDRKAIRILGRLAPGVPIVQTPELLHAWADRAQPAGDRLLEVLQAVQLRARFTPRRDVPFSDWWMRSLGADE